MFWFGNKNKKEDMNVDLSKVDLSKSNDLEIGNQRYEYTIKVFDVDDHDKPIATIQHGVKANSDQELASFYAMCDQRIQILEKREINPPKVNQSAQNVNKSTSVSNQINCVKIEEPKQQTKYFSAGGIDFKMVGQEVFQKQWVNATEEECKKIRIINDKTNKIVSLKDKHLEIQHWIKIENSSTDDQV